MDSSQHGLILDLNRYRAGKNLEQYLDAGVDGFIFRMGGPSQWVEGDYRYKEDETWRPYMEQAARLGVQDQCGGYIIHNPFEDWRLQGVVSNVHLNLINQWTSGGFMPGYIIVDHEINYCWRGTTKVIATPYNLVQSLASITDQIWKVFKKIPMIYTGRWFVDQNGLADHMAYLDNVNRVEKQRPMWYAGYPNQTLYNGKQYANLKNGVDELTTPSSDYVGKVLQCGSFSMADLWQFTDRLKLTGDTLGVDASVTWGTWAEYCAAVGIQATEPPAPPDPDTPPDELAERVAALETRLAQVEQRLDGAKVTITI